MLNYLHPSPLPRTGEGMHHKGFFDQLRINLNTPEGGVVFGISLIRAVFTFLCNVFCRRENAYHYRSKPTKLPRSNPFPADLIVQILSHSNNSFVLFSVFSFKQLRWTMPRMVPCSCSVYLALQSASRYFIQFFCDSTRLFLTLM